MVEFRDAVAGAVKDAACTILNNPVIGPKNWGPQIPFVGENLPGSQVVRDWYDGLMNATRSIYGCDEPEDKDNVPPNPIQGYQCDCDAHELNFQVTREDGNTNAFRRWIRGPLVSARAERSSNGRTNLFVTSRGASTSAGGNAPPCEELKERQVVFGSYIWPPDTTTTFTGISACFSGCSTANDCGDPPPEYNPTIVYNDNRDITYNIDNGPDITNNTDIRVYAPIIVGPSIEIPFSIDVGGVSFSGELNPSFNISLRPNFSIKIGSESDPKPIEPTPTTPEPTIPIPPIEEQTLGRIVGAWVVLQTRSSQSTVIFQDGVASFYPRTGILKFLMYLEGSVSVSESYDVTEAQQYFAAPRTGRVLDAFFIPYYDSAATVLLAWAEVPESLLLEPG